MTIMNLFNAKLCTVGMAASLITKPFESSVSHWDAGSNAGRCDIVAGHKSICGGDRDRVREDGHGRFGDHHDRHGDDNRSGWGAIGDSHSSRVSFDHHAVSVPNLEICNLGKLVGGVASLVEAKVDFVHSLVHGASSLISHHSHDFGGHHGGSYWNIGDNDHHGHGEHDIRHGGCGGEGADDGNWIGNGGSDDATTLVLDGTRDDYTYDYDGQTLIICYADGTQQVVDTSILNVYFSGSGETVVLADVLGTDDGSSDDSVTDDGSVDNGGSDDATTLVLEGSSDDYTYDYDGQTLIIIFADGSQQVVDSSILNVYFTGSGETVVLADVLGTDDGSIDDGSTDDGSVDNGGSDDATTLVLDGSRDDYTYDYDGQTLIIIFADGSRQVVDSSILNVYFNGSGETVVLADVLGTDDGSIDNGSTDDSGSVVAEDQTLTGGKDADILTGGAGNDLINGHCGDDVISGGDGNDTLLGEGGNDTISGGAGNDDLNGGWGVNSVDGGEGTDVLVLYGTQDNYTFTFDGETLVATALDGTQTTTAVNIEKIFFTDSKQMLDLAAENSGDANEDTTTTDGGSSGSVNDCGFITGTDCDDALVGTGNDDVFLSSDGNDAINGGEGFDQVGFQGNLADYTFTMADDGTVIVTSDAHGTDTLSDVEAVWDHEGNWSTIDDLVA